MPQGVQDPFETLSLDQRERLRTYAELLRAFNEKINLISRENQSDIMDRHIRHVLALAVKPFPAGASVVDWGTGGGLPAIPLAVCFPDVTIHAVDAVGKKIQAIQAMSRKLGLKNLHAWHTRAEQWKGHAHYSVSRATAPLADLWGWHVAARVPLQATPAEAHWQPGLICLKGGDLTDEIADLKAAFPETHVEIRQLATILAGRRFQEKLLVQVRD